ncbi:MAG TPA: PAS domain S-box protein [Burkholderiaceae bacterium]
MRPQLSASLKLTVPLILLAFAAVLSTVNLLYHVPQAERVAEDDSRKRLAQELSRLQSTLEYLLLKGDGAAAQHEIEVLAHNHDVIVAALTDDRGRVVTATRRAWLGQPVGTLLPQFELQQAADAIRERRGGMTPDARGDALLGYAGVLLAGGHDELRSSRVGGLYLAYDLARYKAEARAQVMQQSLYWAGWVTALALAMWAAFHVLLTRRTARLVHAAEQLAAGRLDARSALHGGDELGRLSRAFDAMALEVAETQQRLRHDIAERARVQHELAVSEASYRAIFEAAEDVILVHDIDSGAIVDANPKACSSFGYTLDEFRRLDIGLLGSGAPGYTRADAMRLFARAVAGEPLHFEWHSRLRDGSLRWHEVFGKRVTVGGHDRILSLARDITDRKLAEDALAASEEQYRAMFNASIDGLALWDASGAIVDTNPALRRMVGRAEADPPGARWTGPSYPAAFLRAVAAGQSLHTKLSSAREDGSALELELHGIPMTYQGAPHVLTIARDITEKRRQTQELQRQRESLHQREKLAALGSLLAGVAHELNNPLSVVVARAVLLEEQGNAAAQAAAAKIRSAAERCARIVRTFLAMARQQQPQRGPVAVNEVVHAALDIAGYALRNGNVELRLDLALDLPPIRADADQLHQVLLNLIINAQQSLQERAPPRRIRIASRFDAAERRVRLTVADNGPGIPEPLRARVFEPYFTTKPTGMGTGVGLAVSLGIVEAHGGTIAIETPREGGVAFVVALPAGELPAGDPQTLAPASVDGPGLSILVVDDEADVRETLAEILEPLRHRVVAVASAREALRRMKLERYDVIFTDVRMPDLDGRMLYREIERHWPAQAGRVVFVTGDTLTAGLREFVRESGRPVLEKPFLPSDVRRMVVELGAD